MRIGTYYLFAALYLRQLDVIVATFKNEIEL